jgi:hypothetical protein
MTRTPQPGLRRRRKLVDHIPMTDLQRPAAAEAWRAVPEKYVVSRWADR